MLLVGCRLAEQSPLPTLVPTAKPVGAAITMAGAGAVAPEARQVPVTFTPAAMMLQAGITTREVTPTPAPTATAEPSATPAALPITYYSEAPLPYRAEPPESVPCGDQGLAYRSSLPGGAGGGEITYHVYLPPCYGLDGRVYPVLYLIHGSIQTDSHWLDLGLDDYADAGILSGRYPPFIAIMPYSGRLGNMTSGGPNSVEGNLTDRLIPAIDDLYCTWPEAAGRAIGGISRGGYWALEIAFRHPELFGAVSGHSSHLRFETDSARYNPLATYATADLSNMRIWLDRGETDFLRSGQDLLHERLIAAGIAHEYRINPGGHSDAYWAQHLPEYLDWHLALWPHNRDAYEQCG
ncbi:MAG: alpha/beta hydrolase [Candidatus Promineifilaceae bacterium]